MIGAPIASRLDLFLAKFFGRRIEVASEGFVTVAYQWRGRFYVTEVHPKEHSQP